MPHKHSKSVKSLFFAHLTRNLFRMINFPLSSQVRPRGRRAATPPLRTTATTTQTATTARTTTTRVVCLVDPWNRDRYLGRVKPTGKKKSENFYVKSKRNIFFFYIKVVPPSWSHSELYSQPEYCEWESFQQLQ